MTINDISSAFVGKLIEEITHENPMIRGAARTRAVNSLNELFYVAEAGQLSQIILYLDESIDESSIPEP